MKEIGSLAVIGSGPSALYFLYHLSQSAEDFRHSLDSITVFEKTSLAGYGMPYHPETTDRYNRANISSEELPELPETFVAWLRKRNHAELETWGIVEEEISESEVYCRLALGKYFSEQFQRIVELFRNTGIPVDVRTSCSVDDIEEEEENRRTRLRTCTDGAELYDTVVIATGHSWKGEDRAEEGFFSSPWPIFKLLPAPGEFLNHPVGTLGASLSAFDVISSLSHRHGEFLSTDRGLIFKAYEGAEGFELVMHAAEGWLPHLQWDQEEPLREIYRHVSRDAMLSLREQDGSLRIATYFDRVCRPALIDAFEKDEMDELVRLLRDEAFGFEDFVDEMTERHDYVDSFEGMRKELEEARDSVENHRPIHWKETLDDLMYCLNYHAELLPAEDHVFLKGSVMPFLMNVIAAMPLQSATMLLGLHDAGKIRLVTGKVKIEGEGREPGTTRVSVESDRGQEEIEYRMFVDCSGQKPMDLDAFPFQSLAKQGAVREARADFLNPVKAKEIDDEKLLLEDGVRRLRIGGIDVDAAFHIIGQDGTANPRIFDLSFPHTSGVRPYSYGLQACNATAEIVVRTWRDDIGAGQSEEASLREVSRTYDGDRT
ncbi:FAD/NAD(P)-binding protein [Haloferula chungangensis]|uniref:FAD/NAD(P)-binding protein n=1 Tax=Haloferula chungangensis TaxID=1048331 RepID=A0ABW2L333_9BACT